MGFLHTIMKSANLKSRQQRCLSKPPNIMFAYISAYIHLHVSPIPFILQDHSVNMWRVNVVCRCSMVLMLLFCLMETRLAWEKRCIDCSKKLKQNLTCPNWICNAIIDFAALYLIMCIIILYLMTKILLIVTHELCFPTAPLPNQVSTCNYYVNPVAVLI